MGIMPDWMIEQSNIVKPFHKAQKRPGVISYGCSSYGYDARIGYKFKIFTPALQATCIDPKRFDSKSFVEVDLTPKKCSGFYDRDKPDICKICGLVSSKEEYCSIANINLPDHVVVPPNSFLLGETIEEFDIPRDTLAVVLGKSTYARCGIIVNVTPLEPEWRGTVTVEISNTTPLPAKIYCGEGIMQVLFLKSAGYIQRPISSSPTCDISYADKGGKYQDQKGIVTPEVDK